MENIFLFDNDACGLLPNGFVLGAGSHSLLVIGFGKGKNTVIWCRTELKILLIYEIDYKILYLM